MNILLATATAFEIKPFVEYYSQSKDTRNVDVLITGIGLTASIYHLLKQINIKRPSLVIQAGIAGCFDKRMKLGEVVAVKKEVIADQGVVEKKKLNTLFDMGFVKPNQFPFKKGWLVNDNEVLKKVKLKKVSAVSINEITTSKEKIRLYRAGFDPAIESMEGAALHYTCLMEKIPFIQLRAISNYVGERDKKKWQMKIAIENLNKELIKLIAKS